MAARFYTPLKLVALNANVIVRQRSELSKQLQVLHIHVTQTSEALENS
jgi:hypothetical protein